MNLKMLCLRSETVNEVYGNSLGWQKESGISILYSPLWKLSEVVLKELEETIERVKNEIR